MPEATEHTSISILFWNINRKKENYHLIAQAVEENNVDVCVVAEMPDTTEYLFSQYLPNGYKKHPLPSLESKIKYFYAPRFSMKILGEDESFRGSMVRIDLEGRNILNLVGCHLIDSINYEEAERNEAAIEFNRFIRGIEDGLHNYRTVVIGDFNMNPFQRGMISPSGFNAVMCQNVANTGECIHLRKRHRFFYNPMWYYFGHPELMNGTIFHTPLYWNLYDQVLLRPELINSFSHENLKIITQINETSLLKPTGRINKRISDHLPLFVKLKI